MEEDRRIKEIGRNCEIEAFSDLVNVYAEEVRVNTI